jgi:hypothetical protein
MAETIDAAEFRRRTGHEPQQDELERANCPKAGQDMHWLCGLCAHCGRPRFLCPGATCEGEGHI